MARPDGAPIAITGLWDLEFGDGRPQGGKTDPLFRRFEDTLLIRL